MVELDVREARDGEPAQVYEPGSDDPVTPSDGGEVEPAGDESSRRNKLYVNGVEVGILAERVQYYDAHGGLVTEGFGEFSRRNVRRVGGLLGFSCLAVCGDWNSRSA